MDLSYKSCAEMGFGHATPGHLRQTVWRVTNRAHVTNTLFDSKNNGHFLLLEEHFFDAIVMYKKNFEVKFENLPHEIVDFFVRVILMAIFLL
jgi:hypothetical protein